jgi:glycosyltransferase involved in cell wall biosynthesis
MRILMVTTSYPRWQGDAAGAFVHSLAVGLVGAGNHVEVIAPASAGAATTMVMDGVQVSRVGRGKGTMAGEPGGIIPGLYRAPWRLVPLALALYEMNRLVLQRAAECDVVHGHWAFPGGLIATRAAARNRRAVVVTIHGSDINLPLQHRILRPLLRAALKSATAILAVSEAMMNGAIAMGVPPARVSLVRLGVTDYGMVKAEPRNPVGPTRFLFIGSLTRNKGVDVLIEAFAKAASSGEMSLRMVGDGPLRGEVEKAIDAHGLRAAIEMVGLVPPTELHQQFGMADVLVLPSRSEGLGLVCVEAMMAGLPVLVSDIPGPREVVEDRVTGMLVPAGDLDALADSMRELVRNPAMRVAMGRAGRIRAEAMDLTIAGSVNRHLQAYDAAIQDTSS